jgi:hypothetical protein
MQTYTNFCSVPGFLTPVWKNEADAGNRLPSAAIFN